MKEQVKEIVLRFKEIGWTVQMLEKNLQFSNGTLGKVINGKAGMSEFKFLKLQQLNDLTFIKVEPKEVEVIKTEIEEKVADIPEPKKESKIEKMLREKREKFSKQYKTN